MGDRKPVRRSSRVFLWAAAAGVAAVTMWMTADGLLRALFDLLYPGLLLLFFLALVLVLVLVVLIRTMWIPPSA